MKTEILKSEEITDAELDFATGGMNLDGVRESKNVIDARSGILAVVVFTVRRDITPPQRARCRFVCGSRINPQLRHLA